MSNVMKSKRNDWRCFLPFALVVLAVGLLCSCGGGGGGGDSSSTTSTPTTTTPPTTSPPPATTSNINTVYSSAGVLPTSGGILEIKSDLDEVNGASVDIPAGAVSKATTFSFGVVDSLPADSPFGQVPVGKLFGIEPAGTTFAEDVTLTLPIPPGEKSMKYYIGHWNGSTKQWENLGGTIVGDSISTKIKNLSIFGVFYAGKSEVKVVNQSGPTADLGIRLTYVSGPAIPPDANPGEYYPAYRPLPEGGIELKDGESRVMSLLPGRYHFLVSYPRPQPGVSNSLFFTVPAVTQGADDGQVDQTITITLNGATSSDATTNTSIIFPGYATVQGSNLRPEVGCTAFAPTNVPVIDAVTGGAPQPDPKKPSPTHIVNVGPIKIEQLSPMGSLTLSAWPYDPEGSLINLFWTWADGTLPTLKTVPSDTKDNEPFLPNPPRAGVYTVYSTAYDQYRLFDECRWNITVLANTKPKITTIADDFVIDFGRLDFRRRLFAPQPAVDAVPTSGSAAAPPIVPPSPITTAPFGNLCAYVGITTYLRTLPGADAVDPVQYPGGMTCVYAIIGDADGDVLNAGFRIPEPIMGRGTIYAAIPVPSAGQGGAGIVLVDDYPRNAPKTVADILPNGLVAGSILDTYDKIAAYNATLTYLANRGLLPVTGPLLTYAPLQPLPTWPPAPPAGAVRGPQALPVIWEAPDDPDAKGETHDCVTHRFQLSYDPLCQIRRGGTCNIEGWATDTYSAIQRDFGTVAYPDANSVFGGDFGIVSITPSPADPGPGQGVTVTVVIAPATAGVTVEFSIVGTDGYTKSQSPTTDASGVATFYIPGGAKGVVDVVTVKVGSNTAQVTYTF